MSDPTPDPTSDLTFRPPPTDRPPRGDDAWEAVVRQELLKLRRRSPSAPRVVPASREPAADDPAEPRPAA
jgi:hypothetical protein